MEDCSLSIDTNSYTSPTQRYEMWSKIKLEKITTFVDEKLSSYEVPTVIVLEIGHFTLQADAKNLQWAYQNMAFANAMCGEIIKKHKFKFKIIPTLLINNLESQEDQKSQEIISDMVKDQKYITQKSLKIISERNLKNRAFKALKNDSNLTDQFIHIDGKAYLKDDDYQHDLAAGFVNEEGDIIPRCGLILTSYLDTVSKLARERLHQNDEIHLLFISFSQLFHEYKRVMLGVDIYGKTHKSLHIDPMIFHWAYQQDQALLSYKPDVNALWEDLSL